MAIFIYFLIYSWEVIFINNRIKYLSSATINKIAAGEVIERPASVIKELVENAIDAKANEINISLERAGKNLILITDNGIGMNTDELKTAIERHTTSKLNEADLLDIHSFGFRGEALPSIGAISKMSITSRIINSDLAYMIEVIGGIVSEVIPSVHNVGTKIEIRDLFFAVPARLKFLKSERTELHACIQVVEKIALAHPHISFTLSHEGKNLLKLKKSTEETSEPFSKRITNILGKDFIENAVFINTKNDDLTIKGYVSIPTYNRATAEDQYFFVNNRPIKDKALSIALKIAYQDYLARDRYPVVVLFISVDPQNVDVNTHPAKTEVRFNNPNFIKQSLINAVIEALSNNSHKTSTTISETALGYFNVNNTNNVTKPKALINQDINNNYYFSENYNSYKSADNITIVMEDRVITQQLKQDTPLQSSLIDELPPYVKYHEPIKDTSDNFTYPLKLETNIIIDNKIEFGDKKQETTVTDLKCATSNKIINSNGVDYNLESQAIENSISTSYTEPSDVITYTDTKTYFLGAATAQINDTYIISQTNDSIIIVDQHAAHERLVYEKLKTQFIKEPVIKQRLLIPEILELPDQHRASLLATQQQQLANLGLTIELFGDKSVMVSEVPTIFNESNIKQLVLDLADHLLTYGENIALMDLIEHITETYACHHSIRSGRKLNIDEMNGLLREMEKTAFSGQCNHGRPTYVELKINDIEKLFGRK